MELSDTEKKIKEAAQKVFVAKGFSGARMQDIATEAGINKALLHYYFRSKDKLYDEIFLEVFQKNLPKISLIFQAELDLFEKIELFVKEYLTIINANPMVPLFVVNELTKHPEKFMKKVFDTTGGGPKVDRFFSQIHDEVEKGNIRPTDPGSLLINIVSLCAFPYIAKPMFLMVLPIEEAQYSAMLEQRKTEVSAFIINALKI